MSVKELSETPVGVNRIDHIYEKNRLNTGWLGGVRAAPAHEHDGTDIITGVLRDFEADDTPDTQLGNPYLLQLLLAEPQWDYRLQTPHHHH
jgi:hypothetical protein